MRVAVYYSNSDLRLEEMPAPAISADEVLLQTRASGICGSDVMEWYRKDKVPLVLGHEVAGVLAQVGKKVRRFSIGDRVVVTHHVPCGTCEYCRSGHETVCETLRKTNFFPGGFSEFIRIPEVNVQKGMLTLPANMSFEEATFTEPLGCVLRGQRLARIKQGQRILVVGSGLAGLLHVKLAKYLKAKTIVATDIDPYRLECAKRYGATHTLLADENIPEKVKEINQGRKADVAVICAAAQPAVESALRSVERGGTVLFFSAAEKDALLPVPINEIFWRSEMTLLSSYAAAPEDLKEALRLIAQKKIQVSDMITHRLKLSEIQKGFDLTVNPQRSMKVIIEPHK